MKASITLLSYTPDPVRVIERAARTCYNSPMGVSRDDSERFIRGLIGKKHDSVLEHASATFRISCVSRAFLAQLTRHRLCSFSVLSQRYTSQMEAGFVCPDSIQKSEEAFSLWSAATAFARNAYTSLVAMGIPKEDARFVLPEATETDVVVTANFREWRHILKLRLSKRAQWEIREVAGQILDTLKGIAPCVFDDIGEGTDA